MDPLILHKRMQAVYALDQRAPQRRSYENQNVQHLYATELVTPNSPQAHALLHTSYAARHSPRLLLMRLLDCVDRRDGRGAAALFDREGTWVTASPLGTVQGQAAIQAFGRNRLAAAPVWACSGPAPDGEARRSRRPHGGYAHRRALPLYPRRCYPASWWGYADADSDFGAGSAIASRKKADLTRGRLLIECGRPPQSRTAHQRIMSPLL